jgi:hypothetical protein
LTAGDAGAGNKNERRKENPFRYGRLFLSARSFLCPARAQQEEMTMMLSCSPPPSSWSALSLHYVSISILIQDGKETENLK